MLTYLSSKFGTEALPTILAKPVSSIINPILQNLKLERSLEQQSVKNHDYQRRIRFE